MKEVEVRERERRNEAMEAIQKENEELKEVLTDVQEDLESKREVTEILWCSKSYYINLCNCIGTATENSRCCFTRASD